MHWYNPEAIFSLFKKKKKIEKMVFQYFFFPEYQLSSLEPCVPVKRKKMGKWWQGQVTVTCSEALDPERQEGRV